MIYINIMYRVYVVYGVYVQANNVLQEEGGLSTFYFISLKLQ